MAIVLMILGFVWWWPLGLVILGYLFARRRFGCANRLQHAGEAPMFDWSHRMDRWERKIARAQDKMQAVRGRMERFQGRRAGWFTTSTSGNHAFDEYREQTLKRLEEEQTEFKDFLERLRFAKDRSEFDQFMADRRGRAQEPGPSSEPPHPQA